MLLLLACVVVGGTGGYVLATHGHSAHKVTADPSDPAGFNAATPVAVGANAACAIVTGGHVDCWGANPGGLLGTGSGSTTGCDGYCTPTAHQVTDLDGVISLAVGNEFACALLQSGAVDCWGANNYGQLGSGADTNGPESCVGAGNDLPCSPVPVAVKGVHDAVSLAAGPVDACAVIRSGAVYCWGAATAGALGDASANGAGVCSVAAQAAQCSSSPVPVFGLGDATAVSVGSLGACALVHGGRVVCWGNDASAQLGDGVTTGPQTCMNAGSSQPCSMEPVLVRGLAHATAITVGSTDACALLRGGTIDCWGDDSAGALGDDGAGSTARCGPQATACADHAVRVDLRGRASLVAAGQEDTCALLAGGRADCWGTDANGELGDRDQAVLSNCVGTDQRADQPCARTPVPVSGLTHLKAISVGYGSACAVGAGGSVSCWGSNDTGQLGSGGDTGPRDCSSAPDPGPCSMRPVAVDGIS